MDKWYKHSFANDVICLTQVQYVDHGFQAQRVVQRNHGHGVGVAGQLGEDPLSPAEGSITTPSQRYLTQRSFDITIL